MGESAKMQIDKKLEMEMNRLGWNFGQEKKNSGRRRLCGFVYV